MLTYSIKKNKSIPQKLRKSASIAGPTQTVYPRNETREECFARHFAKNIYKLGDRVAFKKPRRNKIRGSIIGVETDVNKMHWSEGGAVPRFLRVKVDKIDKSSGEIYGYDIVWTSPNKLMWSS